MPLSAKFCGKCGFQLEQEDEEKVLLQTSLSGETEFFATDFFPFILDSLPVTLRIEAKFSEWGFHFYSYIQVFIVTASGMRNKLYGKRIWSTYSTETFTVSIPPNYKGEKVVDILIKCGGVLDLKVEKIA